MDESGADGDIVKAEVCGSKIGNPVSSSMAPLMLWLEHGREIGWMDDVKVWTELVLKTQT